MPQTPDRPETPLPDGLSRLLAALPHDSAKRRLPPVERWDPAFCGDLDMRIAADGSWHYLGTPIGRPALVRLFASVVKREGDAYFLVTPVEKLGITVEDAPFVAVEMAADGEGAARRLSFRTNVDDVVEVDAEHGLRFARDGHDGVKPYVHVRRDLWALVTRALTYDLLALGEVAEPEAPEPGQTEGEAMFGIQAGGRFWPVLPARELGPS